MRYILLILLLFSSISGKAQDTLNMMFYNLLKFPSDTKIADRADTLAKIIDYTNPDIFTVCELLWEDGEGANLILEESLGAGYSMAEFIKDEGNSGGLHNMLFYKHGKVGLKSQDIIDTDTRDISVYQLFINNNPETVDTIWLDVFVTHLKAGQDDDDLERRTKAINLLKEYLDIHNVSENRIFAADLNIRSSSEEAYQLLLSEFSDPINMPGTWYQNEDFAAILTQSTRATTDETKIVGGMHGGLDDRLDQILVSDQIMSGASGLKYIEDSYQALGNDGLHFNSSLLAAPVQGIPDSIWKALYYMSDHLPVVMKVSIDPLRVDVEKKRTDERVFVSYIPDHKIGIEVRNFRKSWRFQIRNMWGQIIYESDRCMDNIHVSTRSMASGIYVLEILGIDGYRIGRKKIVVSK